jgi:DNA-directed RNA polymerase subunit alpha
LPIPFKSVCDLEGLSVRALNGLLNGDVLTIDILICKTDAELLMVPNFGKKSLNEVKSALATHGLSLFPCK